MFIVDVRRMVWSVDLQWTYVKPLTGRIPLELTESGGRATDGDSVGGDLANIKPGSGRQMLLQLSIRSKGLLLEKVVLTSFSLNCEMHCSISGALAPLTTQDQASVGASERSILSAVSVAFNPTREATRTVYTAT